MSDETAKLTQFRMILKRELNVWLAYGIIGKDAIFPGIPYINLVYKF